MRQGVLLLCGAAFCFCTEWVGGAVMVEWGTVGAVGDTAIVAANQAFVGTDVATYDPNTAISPAIGANYYSSNAGKNPYFFGQLYSPTGTFAPNANKVWNQSTGGGDSLNTGSNTNSEIYSMFLWKQAGDGASYGFQNGLNAGNVSADTFSLQTFNNVVTGLTTSEFRFVLLGGSNYYISGVVDSTPVTSKETISGTVGGLTWYDYTPTGAGGFASGGTIGGVATLSNDNVVGVGFWHHMVTTTTLINVKTDYFQVIGDAVPEPTIMALLAAGAVASFRLRRRE